MIRAGDLVILAVAVALITMLATSIYTGARVETVQVMHANGTNDYPPWRNRRVRVDGPLGQTLIEIRDGRARVLESPCTQKICVRSGWLESAGEATACLPNRVSLALLGSDPRFDAVNF